jgi:hypothetical protein
LNEVMLKMEKGGGIKKRLKRQREGTSTKGR